jgi:integrase
MFSIARCANAGGAGETKSSDGRARAVLDDQQCGRIGRAQLSGNTSGEMVALAERASIGAAWPHDLRRSFVVGLLDAGEDLSTAAKAARHASVSTTSIYDRRDERRVAEAVGRLVVPFGR